jgi:hypothetical protein
MGFQPMSCGAPWHGRLAHVFDSLEHAALPSSTTAKGKTWAGRPCHEIDVMDKLKVILRIGDRAEKSGPSLSLVPGVNRCLLKWNRRFLFACLIICGMSLQSIRADDKKPAENQPPHLLMTIPLAVTRGTTTKIILRGLNLDNATDVHVEANHTPFHAKIKSKGKAEVPKMGAPEKLGDTQIEIELQIPADSKAAEATIVVVTPNGSDTPHALKIYAPGLLAKEKEPNGGFRTAQEIHTPALLFGVVDPENDVDVFRITAKAGQKLSAAVFAARLGSPLDSLLTLYDDKGHVLVINDDDETADSLLNFTFPRDGTFFLSLTDAYGKGGVMYPYLLRVTVE